MRNHKYIFKQLGKNVMLLKTKILDKEYVSPVAVNS